MMMTRSDRFEEASSRSLRPEQYRPTDLKIDRRDGLRIEWADGHRCHYPLAYLRKQCPCATCRHEREAAAPSGEGLSLTVLPANVDRAAEFRDARLVGHYAMQITWADGHATGIYDFRYLRAICPEADGGVTAP